ncbi:response regulator transcription factor [Sinomonas terrae]|uniref:Response regulator transcription factor n=1 Tax=Sinomonas terrae TaxID=2908838 RepID=A0ABS9U074_9MICC|nr:response regulator transcription factor [Sinomonas terrae]MCH6470092.1 response regulator transcription factor [Sinomonas terrae]
MGAIRVALVNDYEVVVRGLAAMMRSYAQVLQVVELDMGEGAAEPVDITLYDTFAATQGDREEVRRLAADPRSGKVVVYSWNLDPALASAALANGAAGYLSKGLPAGELAAALQGLHRGESEARVVLTGSSKAGAGDWPGREEGLTQREAEVLALITQGLGNAAIAERTGLSPNSVKTFIRSCYRRIGVTTRSNAILWGIEHGFRPDRGRIRPAGGEAAR